MAYNRWLSSQYSYDYNYDLMHYGRKGMKWGKHVFGLPDINLFSNGTKFNTESLRRLLERGQIDYNRFKELTKQAARNVSDTWDNFKAGESADKRPERRIYRSWDSDEEKAKYSRTDDYEAKKREPAWVRSSDGSVRTDWELDKEYYKNRDALRKKAAEEKRYKADKARVEDKIKQHEKQGRKDNMDEANRKKQLEKKRQERKPNSSIQNGSKTENPSSVSGYPTGKSSPSAEELLLIALGAGKGMTEEEQAKREKEQDEKRKKEFEAYREQQNAKQKKIYEAIGKFLNFAIKSLPGSTTFNLAKKLKKK